MATVPIRVNVFLLLIFNGWRFTAAAEWSCSDKVEESSVSYDQDYYCYYADENGVPPIPSIENQDPLLTDSFASRSDKVQSCAKASLGRGFRYFALFNNGECRSSWDATTTYDDFGYFRDTKQYCYYYCYWGCYSRCYSYLVYCGDGYGDSTKMNLYKLSALDVILWIRVKRQSFPQYKDFFNKSSSVSTNVNWIIQSWVKEQIEGSKICGINNGTLLFWRPDTSDYIIGHYYFPTSFKNITYIADKMIGLSRTEPEAQVIAIQQNDGQCDENPYARASMSISNNFENPSVYEKQGNYLFYGYAYFYCTSPAVMNYKWEAALLSPDNTTVGDLTTVSSDKSWSMSALSLNYGLYFVQYTISTPENPYQVGYDYGFMKIIPGPLYVYITKGSTAVYIEKRPMVVDGSETYDPDYFEAKGNYTGMNFTWVCYKSGESVDLDAVDSMQVVYSDGSRPTLHGSPVPPPDLQTGGCFNTGPGILPLKNATITFNNTLMVRGNTYYIALRVQKDQRVGTYTQSFTIAEAPPDYNVSCFSNCASSAVINLRLGLKAHCIDPVKCGTPLSYRWFMYYKDEDNLAGDWIDDNDFYTHLLTSYSGVTEILLQENFLLVDRIYRVTLEVMTQYGAEGYAHYDFRPNTPPQRGTCVLDKYAGIAVLDLFELQCNDWDDYDLPLTYQVTVPTLNDTYIVLAVGQNSSIQLRLPVGDKDDVFRLRLEVYIIDSLVAYTRVNVSLYVLSPEASALESQLPDLIGAHSELENLVNQEDNELAVQISIGVLSAVDNLKENNETTTNTSLLREDIINSITKLRMNDTESVNQIASVLVEATKEEAALTATSGFQSLGACENMSAILALESNNTASTDGVENAGKQIILVTGNVLGGAVLSSKTGNSTELENLAKQALKMADNLAKLFLERLLPGEKPAVFHSSHLSMQLFRQQAGDPLPQDMEVSGGSFLLPSDLALANTSGFLDRNVQFSDLDPFIWAKNNTYQARTPVVSLSFTDEHGNPIPVHDTQSDIEINIPVKHPNNTLSQPTNFINPNDSMAYHSFNITHHDTAFSIRIQPMNETRYIVYLRYGKRPNETHFDYQFLIPDFTSCLPPEDENCTIVSEFMQCLGANSTPYHDANFTKPGQQTYCGPPKNDSVPAPAPPEDGEEEEDFSCPEICSYGNLTFSNCSCDEIPDVSFLFPNATIAEDIQTCRDFINFSLCPNNTMLCKNSINLLSCYLLEFERFEQCRAILTTPRKLFYDIYGRCTDDPFKVFFNHTVGKAGKWYVGVQVYIPPFVNDTEEEEEDEDDFEFEDWKDAVRNMTDEDDVEEYLEAHIVAVVNSGKNTTVELDDDDCGLYRWQSDFA
ncbi:sperm receptor for egg jelly-like [Oculina patagonica]